MGLDTEELYLQGLSSSLPEEVQIQMLHTLPGLEHAEMTRAAYAIEYDCVDPTQFLPTLEQLRWRACTGRGNSTAPPAMRRPLPRAWWPG